MYNLNNGFDPNFGYATLEDYEKGIERMSALMWSDFGKNINLKLLREGKLQGKKFKDIIDPRALPALLLENQPNNSRVLNELKSIEEALNLSYKLLSFYQDSIDNNKLSDLSFSLTPAVLYFGIQGHVALEVMRYMISENPKDYFNQKIEAESKAA